MARKNIFLSMEDVMNLIIIQMMIVTRLIQMKNGMIIKIIMRKVKFLMVVENTNVKLDAKFAIVLLILQSVQLVWMDSLWTQLSKNVWDVMINVSLVVQTIFKIVLLAIQDGLLMDLMHQENSHVQNAQLIIVANAIH